MTRAQEEMRARERYDHVIVNVDLERAVAEVRRLAGLERAAGGNGR